jgi:hypothetical protein
MTAMKPMSTKLICNSPALKEGESRHKSRNRSTSRTFFTLIRSKGKAMADAPRKKLPTPPNGEPVKPRDDRDSTTRSRVSEVQDPEISGDVEPSPRSNSVEPAVDKAGQIIRQKTPIDELH